MNDQRPRPRAFRLDDAQIVIEPQAEAIPAELRVVPLDPDERRIEMAQRGLLARWRPGLGALFWSALGGLVSLALGLWLTQLLEDLFARARALGWIGAGLGAIAIVALGAIVARELAAILRQARIARLHAGLARARAEDDADGARLLVGRLVALYERRSETAGGRAETAEAVAGIIDGRDLIDIAERALLRPLDARAQAEIAAAAKRVSMVTTISPRAVLDLLFVVAQIIYLVRRIAEIYGGRPGLLGFFRLARSVGAHLAITGGVAVGDSFMQQVLGHGVASRISARLGEGVLNGLLTARVGLSALAVCRPAPFGLQKAPGVAEVAPFLFRGAAEKPARRADAPD
jgi:putative membrane protein